VLLVPLPKSRPKGERLKSLINFGLHLLPWEKGARGIRQKIAKEYHGVFI
jgi:hypothetical protein